MRIPPCLRIDKEEKTKKTLIAVKTAIKVWPFQFSADEQQAPRIDAENAFTSNAGYSPLSCC